MSNTTIDFIEILKTIQKEQYKNKDAANTRWELVEVAKIRGTTNGTEVTKELQTGRAVNLIINRVRRLQQLIKKTQGLTVDPILVFPHPSGDGTYVLVVGTHRVHCHIELGYKKIWAVSLLPHEYDDESIAFYARSENVEDEESYKTAPPSLEDWKPCAVPYYNKTLHALQQALPPTADEDAHRAVIAQALQETKVVLDVAKFSEWDYDGKQWAKFQTILSQADLRKLMKFSNLGSTLPVSTIKGIADSGNCPIMNKLVAGGAVTKNGKTVPTHPTKEGWLANVVGNGQLQKTLGRMIMSNRERLQEGKVPLEHEILGHATSASFTSPADVDKARRDFEDNFDGLNEYFRNLVSDKVEKFLETYCGDVADDFLEDLIEFLHGEPNFITGLHWICQHDSEVTIGDQGKEIKKLLPRGASAPAQSVEPEETKPSNGDQEQLSTANGSTPQSQMTFMQ